MQDKQSGVKVKGDIAGESNPALLLA